MGSPSGDSLDLYLDGLLDEIGRARFETRIASEPSLRVAIEASRALDGAIRRLGAPPPESRLRSVVLAALDEHAAQRAAESRDGEGARDGAGALNGAGALDGAIARDERAVLDGAPGSGVLSSGPLEAEPRAEGARLRPARSRTSPVSPTSLTSLTWLGIAAALLLLATAWALWPLLRGSTPSPYPAQAHRTMEQVYRDVVGAGFEPPVICRTNREFEEWFEVRLGQGLGVADPLPAGVAVLGVGYCQAISRATIFVLARVDGEPVLLFVDRAESGVIEGPGPASGLHMAQRTVGELVVCEVSPLADPRVLDLLHVPE